MVNRNRFRLQGQSNKKKNNNDNSFIIQSPYLAHRLVMSNRLSPGADTADGGSGAAGEQIWKQNKRCQSVRQIAEIFSHPTPLTSTTFTFYKGVLSTPSPLPTSFSILSSLK